MRFWRDKSIPTKIIAAFVLVFAATLALGVFGLSRTASVNDRAAEIRDNWLPSTVAIANVAAAVKEGRVSLARLVMAAEVRDPAAVARDGVTFKAAEAAVDAAYASYQPLITAGTEDVALMRAFSEGWTKLKASNARVIEAATAGDPDAMLTEYREGETRYREVTGALGG